MWKESAFGSSDVWTCVLPQDAYLESCRLTDSLDRSILEVKKHSCTNAYGGSCDEP